MYRVLPKREINANYKLYTFIVPSTGRGVKYTARDKCKR